VKKKVEFQGLMKRKRENNVAMQTVAEDRKKRMKEANKNGKEAIAAERERQKGEKERLSKEEKGELKKEKEELAKASHNKKITKLKVGTETKIKEREDKTKKDIELSQANFKQEFELTKESNALLSKSLAEARATLLYEKNRKNAAWETEANENMMKIRIERLEREIKENDAHIAKKKADVDKKVADLNEKTIQDVENMWAKHNDEKDLKEYKETELGKVKETIDYVKKQAKSSMQGEKDEKMEKIIAGRKQQQQDKFDETLAERELNEYKKLDKQIENYQDRLSTRLNNENKKKESNERVEQAKKEQRVFIEGGVYDTLVTNMGFKRKPEGDDIDEELQPAEKKSALLPKRDNSENMKPQNEIDEYNQTNEPNDIISQTNIYNDQLSSLYNESILNVDKPGTNLFSNESIEDKQLKEARIGFNLAEEASVERMEEENDEKDNDKDGDNVDTFTNPSNIIPTTTTTTTSTK